MIIFFISLLCFFHLLSGSTDSEIKIKDVFRKVKCTENLHQQRTDEALEVSYNSVDT